MRRLTRALVFPGFFVLLLASCFPSASPTPANQTLLESSLSPIVPVTLGTAAPTAVVPIMPQTASLVKLLAHWKSTDLLTKGITFSNDDRFLRVRTMAWDPEPVIWSAIDGRALPDVGEEASFPPVHDGLSVSISPDGKTIAEIRRFGDVQVYHSSSPSTFAVYRIENAVTVAFSADAGYLAIAQADGVVWFLSTTIIESDLNEINPGENRYLDVAPISPRIMSSHKIKEISVSPDGTILAVASESAVEIWRIADLSKLSVLDSPVFSSMSFSYDGTLLAVGFRKKWIRLWDVRSASVAAVLEQPQGEVLDVAFSPSGLYMASMDVMEGIFLWGIPRLMGDEADAVRALATKTMQWVGSQTPVRLPTPTPLPTSALPNYVNILPIPWPAPLPSEKQVDEVRACEVELLAKERYPDWMQFGKIETAYPVADACDWAVLAAAFRYHSEEESAPEEGKRAFARAVSLNPGYAFAFPLYPMYLDQLSLVEAPPFSGDTITRAEIEYQWSGMGEPSNLHYRIDLLLEGADSEEFRVSAKVEPKTAKPSTGIPKTLDASLVQAFGASLTDLLPIRSAFKVDTCTDTNPDWTSRLVFADGRTITLKTRNADIYYPGGPFQVEMEDQVYMQYSGALVGAHLAILEALGLPLGEPWAMACFPEDMFELAFP